MDLTTCPECGLVAEVVERDVWDSTDGPVEHATVRCVDRHRFVLPVSSLTSAQRAAPHERRLAPAVRTQHRVGPDRLSAPVALVALVRQRPAS